MTPSNGPSNALATGSKRQIASDTAVAMAVTRAVAMVQLVCRHDYHFNNVYKPYNHFCDILYNFAIKKRQIVSDTAVAMAVTRAVAMVLPWR
jgi:hypothetical protein